MSDSDAERSNRLSRSAGTPETTEIGGAVTPPPGAQTYRARPQVLAPRSIGGLLWIVGAIAIVLYGTILAALNLAASSTEASPHAERAYSGYTAAFALATLAAATLALLVSIPSFFSWIHNQVRRVKIQTWIEVAQDIESPAKEATNGEFELSGPDFVLRVAVANIGSATLDARLNIFVPAQCTIKVLDDPSRHHTVGILPIDSSTDAYTGELEAGDPSLWKYSIAPLSTESYMTVYRHLEVKAPGSGIYPIITRIRAVNAWVRVKVKVQGQ